MNADFFEDAAMELFGETWKSKLPAAIGRDESTLRRQGYRNAISGPVQAAVVAWLILRREFWVLPPSFPEAPFTSIMTGIEVPLEDEMIADVSIAGLRLFGENWKTPMARALGVERTSLWRMVSANAASAPIWAAIRAWMLLYRFSGLRPPFDYTDLPSSALNTGVRRGASAAME